MEFLGASLKNEGKLEPLHAAGENIDGDAAIWRNLEVSTQSNIFAVCSSGPALGFETPESSTIWELRDGDDYDDVGFNDHAC